jgi:2-methylcitrate dehydratase PrpD
MRAGLLVHGLYGFYHGSGSWGALGGAAGVARLLGCDVPQLWHAIGVAEFHAAMTPEMRSVDHPSMLKDGIGWGAAVGLGAAQLAARGFTGIPSLFDAAADASQPLVASLGREYLMRDLYFKPYACCRWAHPAIDAALATARELAVDWREIACVTVHTFEAATHLTSAAPRTTEEAQFSLPWPVAAALAAGRVGADEVLEEGLGDPERQALAARIGMCVDPALEAEFPRQALAWVEIETKDGRHARSDVVRARGDPDTPLSDADLAVKFGQLTEPVLGRDKSAQLARAIYALPESTSLNLRAAKIRPRTRRR